MSGSTKPKKKNKKSKCSSPKSKSSSPKNQQNKDAESPKAGRSQKKSVSQQELDEMRLRKIAQQMEQSQPVKEQTPLWYRVIMFSLLALGLLWIVVYYIFEGLFPIPNIGMWNITIGVGALMLSMLMMTRWR